MKRPKKTVKKSKQDHSLATTFASLLHDFRRLTLNFGSYGGPVGSLTIQSNGRARNIPAKEVSAEWVKQTLAIKQGRERLAIELLNLVAQHPNPALVLQLAADAYENKLQSEYDRQLVGAYSKASKLALLNGHAHPTFAECFPHTDGQFTLIGNRRVTTRSLRRTMEQRGCLFRNATAGRKLKQPARETKEARENILFIESLCAESEDERNRARDELHASWSTGKLPVLTKDQREAFRFADRMRDDIWPSLSAAGKNGA
jgi:hypothetical protein